MAFDRSFPQSLASPVIADSEHFWPRLRCSPLRLKNASAFGSRDYSLWLPYAYSDTLPTSGGRTLQFAYGHKLSLTATFSLSPPPLLRRGVGPLHSAVNPKPALAIPSRRCWSASFLPPFHADAILSAPFLPPKEEEAAYIPSPRHIPFVHRLRRYAHPRPRCTVRRCTDSTPPVGQPLHSLRVCLRLRARAGRHIVLVQAHDKVPVAPCLRDTCRLR